MSTKGTMDLWINKITDDELAAMEHCNQPFYGKDLFKYGVRCGYTKGYENGYSEKEFELKQSNKERFEALKIIEELQIENARLRIPLS